MIYCPHCGSANAEFEAVQGVLGSSAQLRCRHCGGWWFVGLDELEGEDNQACDLEV